jgi:hypothetical protein
MFVDVFVRGKRCNTIRQYFLIPSPNSSSLEIYRIPLRVLGGDISYIPGIFCIHFFSFPIKVAKEKEAKESHPVISDLNYLNTPKEV